MDKSKLVEISFLMWINLLILIAATAKSLQLCPTLWDPHRQQPTRPLCPWDSPGKNTGVGCHFLLQCMKVKSESEVAQSCPTPSYPMDCCLPGPSIHGIFQARVLEWGAINIASTPQLSVPLLTAAPKGNHLPDLYYHRLISFTMDWLDLLAVQGNLKSLLQHHSSKASILWCSAAAKSLQSCPTLCDPTDGSPPASPSLGFSRQEHWSGLPFPFPMHESEKWKWNRSVVSDS